LLLTDSIINVIIDVDRSPNFRMSQPTKPLGSRINSLAGSLHRQHQTRNQIGESIERQKYGKVERLQPRHVEEILGENRVFDYSKIPDALLKNLPRGREDDRICFRPGRLEEMKENECRRFIFFHTPIWLPSRCKLWFIATSSSVLILV